MSVTHKPKTGAQLTGTEYEASDAHIVALGAGDIPAHSHAGADITSGTVLDARIDAAIARDSEVTTAVSDHDVDTTSVHGIANTANLLTTSTKLDDLAAPDDNTDLNASTSAHGLMQKYPGGTSTFLRADGSFAAPTASVSFSTFTQDLGAADRAGNFDITGLSGLTPDAPVLLFQSAAAIASKGNARDEPQMDLIALTGYVVDANTIRVHWNAPSVVVGTYAFAYLVGA